MMHSIEEIKEMMTFAKIADMLKNKGEEEKNKNIVLIILAVIGAVVLVGGIIYAIWRIKERRDEEYDLYDDLDFYYDESDHFDIPDDEEVEVAAAEPVK